MNKQIILNSLKNKKFVDAAKTVGSAGVWIAAVAAVPGVFVYGIPAFLGGMALLAAIPEKKKDPNDPIITATEDEEAI
jgi:hypothetical protein